MWGFYYIFLILKNKKSLLIFRVDTKKFVINIPASVYNSANSYFIHEFRRNVYVYRVVGVGWDWGPENINFWCTYNANDGFHMEYMDMVWEGEFKVFRKTFVGVRVVLIVIWTYMGETVAITWSTCWKRNNEFIIGMLVCFLFLVKVKID